MRNVCFHYHRQRCVLDKSVKHRSTIFPFPSDRRENMHYSVVTPPRLEPITSRTSVQHSTVKPKVCTQAPEPGVPRDYGTGWKGELGIATLPWRLPWRLYCGDLSWRLFTTDLPWRLFCRDFTTKTYYGDFTMETIIAVGSLMCSVMGSLLNSVMGSFMGSLTGS